MQSAEDLKKTASQVRRDIIRMVVKAKSGHPGGSMSSADFMTALYFNVMDQNPETWTRGGKDQDMFIPRTESCLREPFQRPRRSYWTRRCRIRNISPETRPRKRPS